MDTQLIDFHNEMKATKATKAKNRDTKSALRQSVARRKIEILNELKNLGLDSTDLILIM